MLFCNEFIGVDFDIIVLKLANFTFKLNFPSMSFEEFKEALSLNNYVKAAKILYDEKDIDNITSLIEIIQKTQFFHTDQERPTHKDHYLLGLSRLFFVAIIKNNFDPFSQTYLKSKINKQIKNFYFLLTAELFYYKNKDDKSISSSDSDITKYIQENQGSLTHYLFYDILNKFNTNIGKILIDTINFELLTSSDMRIVDNFCQKMHTQTQEMMNQSPYAPECYLQNVNNLLSELLNDLKEPISIFQKYELSLAIYETISSKFDLIKKSYIEIQNDFLKPFQSAKKSDMRVMIQKTMIKILSLVVDQDIEISNTKLILLFELYTLISQNQPRIMKEQNFKKSFLNWCQEPMKEVEKLSKPLYDKILIQTVDVRNKVDEKNSLFNQLNCKLSCALSEFSYYFYVKLFNVIKMCTSGEDAEQYMGAYDSFKNKFITKLQSFTINSPLYLFSKVESNRKLSSYEHDLDQAAYNNLIFYKCDMLTNTQDRIHCCACGDAYSFQCTKCNAKYCVTHKTQDNKCLFCGDPLTAKERKK